MILDRTCAAIVMAAGQGTRMLSDQAKVLHAVAGVPMVVYPIRACLELGVGQVVVVVGHQREAVQAALAQHFDPARIQCVVQAEQRGTGHAVSVAMAAVESAARQILIMNGDMPLINAAQMESWLSQCGDATLTFASFKLADPTGYGRVQRDAAGRPERIVEHKDATALQRAIHEVNAGIYCCERSFLERGLARLTTANAQGEFYLPDLVAEARKEGLPCAAVCADDPLPWLGVNSRAELAAAERERRDQNNVRWAQAGVGFMDMGSTYIDDGVVLSRDVFLEAGVHLRGRTRLGAGTSIGAGCVIHDCEVGEGVEFLPYCVARDARVENGAHVGPFAHLRAGTVLGPDAKVGNFVELKKTTLGQGSKASHLSYLGDATIGRDVNIGAGTITCNYDGVNKHATVMQDGVFVGSNTEIVAPVTLGERCVIGAGTTVTRDVPAAALCITRAETRLIEGYGDREKRKKKRS